MTMTEKEFMRQVIDIATIHGWMHYHTHDSRRSTPGFPDLVLVRERIIFAELKTDAGKATAAQTQWLDAIALAGGDAYLWRPKDWRQIVATLGARKRSA